MSETTYTDTIEHKGKTILFLNMSNLENQQILEAVNDARKKIQVLPKQSVLMLTDMTNMHYGKESLGEGKKFTKENEAYIVKSALLGIDGLKKIGLTTLLAFSGRKNLKAFDSKEEALDWLVQ